jgi:hypothetical protein
MAFLLMELIHLANIKLSFNCPLSTQHELSFNFTKSLRSGWHLLTAHCIIREREREREKERERERERESSFSVQKLKTIEQEGLKEQSQTKAEGLETPWRVSGGVCAERLEKLNCDVHRL